MEIRGMFRLNRTPAHSRGGIGSSGSFHESQKSPDVPEPDNTSRSDAFGPEPEYERGQKRKRRIPADLSGGAAQNLLQNTVRPAVAQHHADQIPHPEASGFHVMFQ